MGIYRASGMMTPTARPPHDWRMVLPEVARHGVILDDDGARVAAGLLRVPPTSRLLDRRSGHCPAHKLDARPRRLECALMPSSPAAAARVCTRRVDLVRRERGQRVRGLRVRGALEGG